MDKPNKTDNAEQPAETADTEGGLTAEKPRSRRRKTSIAHIATVCGSVYTGGKTAKDIEKQAEQSAITADDGEIIEIPEPVELYETDCLREPEDSEDASPYDPLSAVCLNGRRSVEELMETGNLSDIDRLRGIVVCEERPLNKKREYANRLTELLGGTLHMLPPVRSGNDVWKMLFDEIPSVFVVSVSLPDIDAFALINTLRQSKLCRNARFFVCAPKMTKSLIGISRNEKIDGLLSFSAPVEQTAAAIIEKCLDYEKKRGKSDLEALEQAINNPAFFSELDEQKRRYAMVTDSILLPLGLQNEHRGTEFLRLLVCSAYSESMRTSNACMNTLQCIIIPLRLRLKEQFVIPSSVHGRAGISTCNLSFSATQRIPQRVSRQMPNSSPPSFSTFGTNCGTAARPRKHFRCANMMSND